MPEPPDSQVETRIVEGRNANQNTRRPLLPAHLAAQPMLTTISSMATRPLLADMAAAWRADTGMPLALEAVGGVDAARRVASGEVFDVVVLAADAIARLAAAGHLRAGSERAVVRCGVAAAVPAGAPRPDITSVDALRRAVLAAASIGCSTGPSGVQLIALFERWGIAEQVAGRLVQAPPGVPVGALLARGEVALGFQQRSELLGLDGIQLLGDLPGEARIVTTFSAAVASASTQPAAALGLVDFLAAPRHDEARARHGFTAA
jgi:molybdate transport system substrate-binding protein